jgi:drug/metabolite transporter (DMT)-like permease
MDVYAGSRFQTVSPAGIAAVSFTLTMVFFLAVEWQRQSRGLLDAVGAHRRDIAWINLTTAVTWMATLFALVYLAPAVVNVLGLGLGPVITILVGGLLRRSRPVLRIEVWVSIGICTVLGGLVLVSFEGRSGLAGVSVRDGVIGLILTIICAGGSSANIIFMKRLSDAGCGRGSVLASRFVLMSAAAWILVAIDRSDVGAAAVPGAVVAVIGVGLPIYVLQIGIKHTEPITTSLLISLSPLFAFLLQLVDTRIRFSPLTLGGIVLVLVLIVIGAVARDRHDASARDDERARGPSADPVGLAAAAPVASDAESLARTVHRPRDRQP